MAGVSSSHGRARVAPATTATRTSSPISVHFSMIEAVSAGAARGPRRSEPRAVGGAYNSWNEKDLPRRLPPFELPVRFGGLLQRELVIDPELDLAVTDPAQQLV